MQNNNVDGSQRYRSLVLTHLCLVSRKRGVPIRALPQEQLARLGVTSVTDQSSVTTFRVDIPEDLESPRVKEMLSRFEDEARCMMEGRGKAGLRRNARGERKSVRFGKRGGQEESGPGFWAEPLGEEELLRISGLGTGGKDNF